MDDFQKRAEYFDNQSRWVMDEKINYIPYKYLSYKSSLGSLLDAGGGTGFLSYYLSNKIDTSSITIVDSSINMLKKAKERMPQAKIIDTSIESYCNTNFQTFDTILARQIFHYVDDVNTIITLLKEKLKKNGVIYVGQFVVSDTYSNKWHEDFIKKISKSRKRSFILKDFLDLFSQNGFCINKIETVDYEENIKNFYQRRTNFDISYETLLESSKEALNTNVINNLMIKTTNDNIFFTIQFCNILLSKI